jgi:succinate dehydrogenase/fumarate reductase-like Fe-S protein
MDRKKFMTIFIMGKKCEVPGGLTIQQAYEYTGYRFIRGCGCRGGVCGACATIYRFPGSYKIETGLACQTEVKENMHIVLVPFFPVIKALYDIDKLKAEMAKIGAVYPEIFRCLACNTCTKSCPMDIKVMDAISATLKGEIEKAANLSLNCVMCGLCAARCPAEITPYAILLLCRRIYGRYIQVPLIDIPPRIKEIESGKYDAELDRLEKLDEENLKELYKEFQADKRII